MEIGSSVSNASKQTRSCHVQYSSSTISRHRPVHLVQVPFAISARLEQHGFDSFTVLYQKKLPHQSCSNSSRALFTFQTNCPPHKSSKAFHYEKTAPGPTDMQIDEQTIWSDLLTKKYDATVAADFSPMYSLENECRESTCASKILLRCLSNEKFT